MVSGQPSLAVECVQCGAALPANAKFCLECGTPVQAPDERESRRTVTLLFTDVTGSTAMGEQLDPEAYRGVMGRYFAVARAAVERHGGRVEKFVGDAVLAVFGLPEVREDDALRAVRAAHELNLAVAELSDRLSAELGVRLQIRTGINTGAVVTGSARAGGSFATGDAVNTAARLEQAAGPGEILLGETTHTLVRDAVESETVSPVQAKGKHQPVAAHRLLSVLDEERGRRRRDNAALVGRERESRALDDALERTLATGRAHLVTVIGPAGIGKSRLLTEFLARVGDRAAVASGRCVSYGQGITYWPLVQALRDALTLSGTESDEIVRHAVEQALGGVAGTEDAIELLMPLLGRSGTPGSSESTFWAVRRLLEELASRRPLVLTFDDLHWAEPTFLELLERVRDEVDDLPLLLVCQARPELIEQHPAWGSGALNAMTMTLDPLSTENVGASVAALLDDQLPPALVATVAEWSGGNPLFVEEIVAHLVESGALQHDEGAGWTLTTVDRLEMPPTVSALLTSRLDRLPAAERDLIGRLSVIGLEFTAGDAALLVDTDGLSGLLTALARRDLLRRMRSSSGDSWAFKHIMVRDAAYDSLAKSLRAELHERFADGLADDESIGADRGTFLAHHLAQAAAYRRELGDRSDQAEELVERAVEALLTASQSALDREEYEAAVALVERAEGLAPASSVTRRHLLLRLVTAHQHLVAIEAAGRTLDRLADAQDESSTELDHAALDCLVAVTRMMSSEPIDPAEVAAQADEMVRLAEQEGATWLKVLGLHQRSQTRSMLGRWEEAAETSEEISRLGEVSDDRVAIAVRGAAAFLGPAPLSEAMRLIRERGRVGANTRAALRLSVLEASTLAARRDTGAVEALRRAEEQARAIAERGQRSTEVYLIDTYALLGDLDSAIRHAQACNDDFRAVGDTTHASTYILFQTALMLQRGDPPEAVRDLIEEADRYTSPYDALSVAYLAGCQAVVAARTGDPVAAAEKAETAVQAVDSTDQAWQQADLRRLVSEVFAADGNSARARQLLEEARQRYHGKEITAYDGDIDARLARLS